jgi:cytochrome c6
MQLTLLKHLKKSDLEQYGMYALEAIKTQVTNGKLAMPSFDSFKR